MLDTASLRGDAEFELIDLRDHPLPHLDEAVPPMFGPSPHAATRAWTERIAPFDGFLMVTPEYNGGMPGVLKNAIDHVFAEWVNKAVGFVSYGVDGGARSVVRLRTVCGTLGLADVGYQVSISVLTDFENHATFVPNDRHLVTPARPSTRSSPGAPRSRRCAPKPLSSTPEELRNVCFQ
ncbi:NADPH-dependent FMN reductase [Nocardia seriolae]|uniref:FMN reductase n=1 Tax=Nocardia seriolae TaxID=37332 RepID=A0ABC9Z4I0_9NOCA|nr:NAD(P)H-dependent oxidoreductase [Nocardia seriolae]APA95858.1 NAD(P)H-dependent FMN reductase [Nocardia seriolae]WKY53567.1 NAD(P)H-dependent oxidoreductase [Nocardia seriolae]WNJ60301.1 NAD(P)H-dependent oxidoreductase [Nocardia seriolae]BEK85333.1 NAD(P)H-dependent oxidoreductase [Nocardia seriolae]BEK98829.1 NAD(P)H-dependent oxidoreductase [Nocardia seriolae]